MSRARKLRRFALRHAALLAACKPLTPEDRAFYEVCFETCGDYPHHDRLYAIVRGKRVHEWADAQGHMDGGTWDESGPEEVYDIVYNVAHVGGPEVGIDPIDRWRAEGYVLDLTRHEDFDPDCESVDCKDQACPYRVHVLRVNGETFCGHVPEEGDADPVTDIAQATCAECKAMHEEQLRLSGVPHVISKRSDAPGYGF